MNLSAITHDALRSTLAVADTNHSLDRLEELPRVDVPHEHLIGALDGAREEFGAESHH